MCVSLQPSTSPMPSRNKDQQQVADGARHPPWQGQDPAGATGDAAAMLVSMTTSALGARWR